MSEQHSQQPPDTNCTGVTDDAILRLLDRPLDELDILAATERVAQSLTTSDQERISLLAFGIGAELLAFPSCDVIRVTLVAQVHRIPHRTNPVVRGLCNIEGELLICINLPAILGMPESAAVSPADETERTHRQRMVVFGRQQEPWVITVNEILGVVQVETTACLPPPATVQGDVQCYTRNLAPLGDGRMLSVLDTERLDSGFKAALT